MPLDRHSATASPRRNRAARRASDIWDLTEDELWRLSARKARQGLDQLNRLIELRRKDGTLTDVPLIEYFYIALALVYRTTSEEEYEATFDKWKEDMLPELKSCPTEKLLGTKAERVARRSRFP